MDQQFSSTKTQAGPVGIPTAAESKKAASLKSLCSQLEQAIQSLQGREDGQRTIEDINKSHVYSVDSYAITLFESYAAMVSAQTKELNQVKASVTGQKVNVISSSGDDEIMTDMDDIEFMRDVPHYLYQGTGKQIAGWDALKRNIFWIRLTMMFFCFISFSVMESLPYLNYDIVSSNELLSAECGMKSQYGEFSYTSYQFVSGISIVTSLYSLFFCFYYLIPVDAQERKYIPASPLYLLPLRWEKRVLFEQKASSRYLEVFMDFLLLVLCLWAAIAAAVSIDHSEAFHSPDDIWTSVCPYGDCLAVEGTCLNEYSRCEYCDDFRCADGRCANAEGRCEYECDDAVRCLDGSCPDDNNACDYGPDNRLMTRIHVGPKQVYYSLHTFVNTFDAMSASCIDHHPLDIIRASVSFLFFSVILMLAALQISIRSLYLEKVKSDVVAGKKCLPLADESTHDAA